MENIKDEVNSYLKRYSINYILDELNTTIGFFDNLISRSFYPTNIADKFTINDVITAIELNENLTIEYKKQIIEKFLTKVWVFKTEQFGL